MYAPSLLGVSPELPDPGGSGGTGRTIHGGHQVHGGNKRVLACFNDGSNQGGHTVDNAQPHVSVERGEGLVSRFGDSVVLVTEEGQHEKGTEEVLQAVEAAAGGDSPGAVMAARLASIVAGSEAGAVPPFGVVAPLADSYVVLLHGAVWAEITGPDGSQRLSGQQAVTWVDHKIELPLVQLSIGSGEAPIEVDPRSDLRAGLVPGSGFIMTPAGSSVTTPVDVKDEVKVVAADAAAPKARATQGPAAPSEDIAPAPAPSRPTVAPAAAVEPPAIAVEATEPVPTAPVAEAPVDVVPPAPAAPAAPAPAHDTANLQKLPDPPRPDPPRNDPPKPDPPQRATTDLPAADLPAAEANAAPQREPAGATQMVVRPVGFLVAGDGMRIPLDRAYVLGRAPEEDSGVTSGAATPVKLDDQDNLISRVHSHVAVDAGQVTVRDASSANGTYIAEPGAADWTRVGSDPVALPPTWSLRVGKQIFTFVTFESVGP